MKALQRIRQKVIEKDYYLSDHAEEEMLDDELERVDIENAILKGRIEKKLTEDIRGTRYRIEGPARDGRMIHVVCRFKEHGNLILITAYAL
ncbi:MAG: DUF4258 domain-containing protein [Nitrospirae bacterium]|nr:DUF4258 domain-containing protein [Nitrospirota bacterium]